MNRQTRQQAHLSQKIAEKESRSHKKPGKRTKRWKEFAAQYQAPAAS
jgi:hypothetical protein